jgi:hypothetical protein
VDGDVLGLDAFDDRDPEAAAKAPRLFFPCSWLSVSMGGWVDGDVVRIF